MVSDRFVSSEAPDREGAAVVAEQRVRFMQFNASFTVKIKNLRKVTSTLFSMN